MDKKEQFEKEFNEKWSRFVQEEQLSKKQENQFSKYMDLLEQERKKVNLTAITDPQNVVAYHFRDSIRLGDFVDLKKTKTICDVGTGGGFPGIPLKILFPHLHLILIEVNLKKVNFLSMVTKELGLENCEVVRLDWRTFLRKTDYPIDIFCARASLHPDELIRMFKPSCPYKEAVLFYWASKLWEPENKEKPFLQQEHFYKVGSRRAKLVAFEKQKFEEQKTD